jgi:hypothetical protein
MLQQYLRSCGVNATLVDAIFASAQSDQDIPPYPASWSNADALAKCHYAAMHLLFLGNLKSGVVMTSILISQYDLLATFGRQANIYLRAIQKLRASKYYAAQPLSTSSWGTGVWVSENYLFWARAIKFFATLPALHQTRI